LEYCNTNPDAHLYFDADFHEHVVLHSHFHLVFDPDCYPYQYINIHGYEHADPDGSDLYQHPHTHFHSDPNAH
jgi:hypothetical protein